MVPFETYRARQAHYVTSFEGGHPPSDPTIGLTPRVDIPRPRRTIISGIGGFPESSGIKLVKTEIVSATQARLGLFFPLPQQGFIPLNRYASTFMRHDANDGEDQPPGRQNALGREHPSTPREVTGDLPTEHGLGGGNGNGGIVPRTGFLEPADNEPSGNSKRNGLGIMKLFRRISARAKRSRSKSEVPHVPRIKVTRWVRRKLGEPQIDPSLYQELALTELKNPKPADIKVGGFAKRITGKGYRSLINGTIYVNAISAEHDSKKAQKKRKPANDLAKVIVHEAQHDADIRNHPVRSRMEVALGYGITGGGVLLGSYLSRYAHDLGLIFHEFTKNYGEIYGLLGGYGLNHLINPAERRAKRAERNAALVAKFEQIIIFPGSEGLSGDSSTKRPVINTQGDSSEIGNGDPQRVDRAPGEPEPIRLATNDTLKALLRILPQIPTDWEYIDQYVTDSLTANPTMNIANLKGAVAELIIRRRLEHAARLPEFAGLLRLDPVSFAETENYGFNNSEGNLKARYKEIEDKRLIAEYDHLVEAIDPHTGEVLPVNIEVRTAGFKRNNKDAQNRLRRIIEANKRDSRLQPIQELYQELFGIDYVGLVVVLSEAYRKRESPIQQEFLKSGGKFVTLPISAAEISQHIHAVQQDLRLIPHSDSVDAPSSLNARRLVEIREEVFRAYDASTYITQHVVTENNDPVEIDPWNAYLASLGDEDFVDSTFFFNPAELAPNMVLINNIDELRVVLETVNGMSVLAKFRRSQEDIDKRLQHESRHEIYARKVGFSNVQWIFTMQEKGPHGQYGAILCKATFPYVPVTKLAYAAHFGAPGDGTEDAILNPSPGDINLLEMMGYGGEIEGVRISAIEDLGNRILAHNSQYPEKILPLPGSYRVDSNVPTQAETDIAGTVKQPSNTVDDQLREPKDLAPDLRPDTRSLDTIKLVHEGNVEDAPPLLRTETPGIGGKENSKDDKDPDDPGDGIGQVPAEPGHNPPAGSGSSAALPQPGEKTPERETHHGKQVPQDTIDGEPAEPSQPDLAEKPERATSAAPVPGSEDLNRQVQDKQPDLARAGKQQDPAERLDEIPQQRIFAAGSDNTVPGADTPEGATPMVQDTDLRTGQRGASRALPPSGEKREPTEREKVIPVIPDNGRQEEALPAENTYANQHAVPTQVRGKTFAAPVPDRKDADRQVERPQDVAPANDGERDDAEQRLDGIHSYRMGPDDPVNDGLPGGDRPPLTTASPLPGPRTD